MSLGKKDIVSNISSEAFLNKSQAKEILEAFIKIIKSNNTHKIKIFNFGSFFTHSSPQRIGRNPKTGEEFIISKREKIVFKASNKLKKSLN